jgi:SH3-like domain-containing protein
MLRTAAFLALALAAAACSKSPSGADDAGTPPGVAPAPTGPVAAHVRSVTALRRQPSDAARVPGPAGKNVSNQLAILQRGERVTVVETLEEWAKVRSSDDQEGWLRRAAVLEGEGVEVATVLAPADVFDRPDLLAANARRKIEPGTLLLVVKARPPFAEVNVSSGPNAWVLAERLATGEKEVSVAKLAEKARWLARNGRSDEAKQILAVARQHFPGISLVDTLAAELGDTPGVGGGIMPASAPTAPPAGDR